MNFSKFKNFFEIFSKIWPKLNDNEPEPHILVAEEISKKVS